MSTGLRAPWLFEDGDAFVFAPRMREGAVFARLGSGAGDEGAAEAAVLAAGSNAAPVVPGTSVTVAEAATAKGIGLLRGATDPDGDALRVENLVITDSAGTVLWSDGTGSIYAVLKENGAAVVRPSDFADALGAGESETLTFTYDVSDGRGGVTQGVSTMTITGEGETPGPEPEPEIVPEPEPEPVPEPAGSNAAPVVPGTSVTVAEAATAKGIGLLRGATDPDGDALRVENLVITDSAGTVLWSDGTGSIYAVLKENGAAVVRPSDFADALGAGESETLTFTYDVSDGRGGVTQGVSTMTITGEGETPGPEPEPEPANAAPVTAPIDAGSVSEDGAPVIVDLLARASDADGDALGVAKVAVTAGSGAAVAFTLSGGQLTVDPGQFGAALDAGDVETLSVSYDVVDGRGGVAAGSATLDVLGADDAPPPPPPAPTIGSSYVSGGAASNFNVEVVFTGTWIQELKAAFADAADAISAIITGDLPDVASGGGMIDDIRITATLAPIDGAYNTVGYAGPTNARWGSYLPYLGEMTFDSADADRMLDQGIWGDVIFHEMMHAIGFGTLWEYMGLVTDYAGDLRFTGANAIQAYGSGFPAIAGADPLSAAGVPVETDGGAGTAGGHWDEATFGNEVMTGWVDGTNYLADITVAALQDMGYDTAWGSGADVGGLWAGASARLQGRLAVEVEDAVVVLAAEDGSYDHLGHHHGHHLGHHDDPFAIA